MRKLHHFGAVVVELPAVKLYNNCVNQLLFLPQCARMRAGVAIQAEWGIYSMLNKLKRAALGAHTPHDKATAASKPAPMPLPAQVRILMSQHIGAPAKALVKKGDEVFDGTKIGEAGGYVYVIDTNAGAIPFVNTTLSTDITAEIKKSLGVQ